MKDDAKTPESLILLTIKSEKKKDNAQNKKMGQQEHGAIKIFQ